MISTNKTQPAPQGEPEKLRIVTTNKLKPRELAFKSLAFPGVDKRPTRKVGGGMLTTIDLEERKRLAKRAQAVEELRAARAKQAQLPATTEPKKKAGRTKKT
jgi:hypothetical protein